MLSPAWCVLVATRVFNEDEWRVPRAALGPFLQTQPSLATGEDSGSVRAQLLCQLCCLNMLCNTSLMPIPSPHTFSGGLTPARVTAEAPSLLRQWNTGRAETQQAGSPALSCLWLSQLAKPS